MKKYLLLLIAILNIAIITIASACPYEFSPDDARPFFEQYEEKEQCKEEKEKSCAE